MRHRERERKRDRRRETECRETQRCEGVDKLRRKTNRQYFWRGGGERQRDKPGIKGRFFFCFWRLGQQRCEEKKKRHFYCIAYALLYF